MPEQSPHYWYQVCMLLLAKLGTDHLVITEAEFEACLSKYITSEMKDGDLHIKILTEAKVLELQQKEMLRNACHGDLPN